MDEGLGIYDQWIDQYLNDDESLYDAIISHDKKIPLFIECRGIFLWYVYFLLYHLDQCILEVESFFFELFEIDIGHHVSWNLTF